MQKNEELVAQSFSDCFNISLELIVGHIPAYVVNVNTINSEETTLMLKKGESDDSLAPVSKPSCAHDSSTDLWHSIVGNVSYLPNQSRGNALYSRIKEFY